MMLPMPFLRRIAPQLRQWRLPRLLLLVLSRRQARTLRHLGLSSPLPLRRRADLRSPQGCLAANAILDVLDHVFCLVLQPIQKPMP
jgi:hypothetical protein